MFVIMHDRRRQNQKEKKSCFRTERIRSNGLSCTGYSSSRAGAGRYTAVVFCIPASNYFAGEDGKEETEQVFNVPHSLPFHDACLLKGFIYHKAASRWLGKLHRNVSGTLGWINFCALLN